METPSPSSPADLLLLTCARSSALRPLCPPLRALLQGATSGAASQTPYNASIGDVTAPHLIGDTAPLATAVEAMSLCGTALCGLGGG